MNHLVLSRTATIVPSGTRSSCYRGPESELTPWRSIPSSPRNFPNLESFGFLLTDRASRLTVDSDRAAKPHAPAGRLLGQRQSPRPVTAAACLQCRKRTEAAPPLASPNVIQEHGGPSWTT